MKKKLKTLHLASFSGNTGDLLNHDGFYRGLASLENYEFIVEKLEIRDFYKNRKIRKFDINFISEVNKYDILIVGGGNYFELWVDDSPTGTTFMIDPELFRMIKIPVIFNALGVDPGKGASPKNVKKFKNFLKVAVDCNSFLSIRNDGSVKTLKNLCGSEYAEFFTWTPDGGFNSIFEQKKTNDLNLLVNVAGDMQDVRFTSNVNFFLFLDELCKCICTLMYKYKFNQIFLMPHIYKDIEVIPHLLNRLPEKMIREKLVIAELQVSNDIKNFKKYYSNSDLILATRFHSNIAGIVACKPTIGLANYRKIFELYAELGIPQRAVDVRVPGFASIILKEVENLSKCANTSIYKKQLNHYKNYIYKIQAYLDKFKWSEKRKKK